MDITALGMIETIGLVAAVEAADAGLKAADVHLLGTDYVRGGLIMVRFEGEVAAVKAAVDAGTAAAQRIGQVFSSHVIPRAMPEVFCMLASDPTVGPNKKYSGGCASCGGCEGGRRELLGLCKPSASMSQVKTGEQTVEKKEDGVSSENILPDLEVLKKMKVIQLRQFVRKLKNFPLTPNDIRYANKAALLTAIAEYRITLDNSK